jgi:hypothetical protein
VPVVSGGNASETQVEIERQTISQANRSQKKPSNLQPEVSYERHCEVVQ